MTNGHLQRGAAYHWNSGLGAEEKTGDKKINCPHCGKQQAASKKDKVCTYCNKAMGQSYP